MARKHDVIEGDLSTQTQLTPICKDCTKTMIFLTKGLFHDKFGCTCGNWIGIPNTKSKISSEAESDFGSGAYSSSKR